MMSDRADTLIAEYETLTGSTLANSFKAKLYSFTGDLDGYEWIMSGEQWVLAEMDPLEDVKLEGGSIYRPDEFDAPGAPVGEYKEPGENAL